MSSAPATSGWNEPGLPGAGLKGSRDRTPGCRARPSMRSRTPHGRAARQDSVIPLLDSPLAVGLSANRSPASRGPSPGFRFSLYAIIATTLMYLDQRGVWLAEIRYMLQGAAYPIQVAVSSPSTAWRWMQESSQSRDTLRV